MIRAISDYRGFSNEGRLDPWEARLRVNEAELKAFAELPFTNSQPKFSAPAPNLPDESRPDGASTRGIASVLAEQVRTGQRRATDIAEAYIEAATAKADHNLFTTFDANRILEDAAKLDREVAAGATPGPLAGVPVPVKDLICVKGYPRTGGTRALPASEGHDDAPAIARLRAAGAIPGGMTNLHELAYGATGDNPHFGDVRNPRVPGHIAGGSSSGSAAAVAAALSPIAVGTDTSGSVRIPSTFCGTVGFKPSYDRIDRAGVLPLAWSLDHVGPIGATVADAALLYAVLAGLDPQAAMPRSEHSPGQLTFVKPANHFFENVDDKIVANIEAVIGKLSEAGHRISEQYVPEVGNCLPIHVQTVTAEAAQVFWNAVTDNPGALGPDVLVRLQVGQFLASVDYVKAQQLRTAMRAALQDVLADRRILIVPTVATTAPRRGDEMVSINGRTQPLHPALTRFTTPFNQTGLPAITIPCGTNDEGHPVGLQLAAAYGNDTALLQAAWMVEQVIEGVSF